MIDNQDECETEQVPEFEVDEEENEQEIREQLEGEQQED